MRDNQYKHPIPQGGSNYFRVNSTVCGDIRLVYKPGTGIPTSLETLSPGTSSCGMGTYRTCRIQSTKQLLPTYQGNVTKENTGYVARNSRISPRIPVARHK